MAREKNLKVGVEELFEPSVRKVLAFLVEHRRLDYSKGQIAKHAGISKPTLYRIWPIMESRLVKPTKKYGNSQLYQINEDNEIVKKMIELDMSILRENFKEFELLGKHSLEIVAELLQKLKTAKNAEISIEELKEAMRDVNIVTKGKRLEIIETKAKR